MNHSLKVNTIIIFLFPVIYLFANIIYPALYDSNSLVFWSSKFIPVITIFIFLLLVDKKINIDDYNTKIWFLFYFLFFILASFSNLFAVDITIGFKYLSIYFLLSIPLLLFNYFIDTREKHELMIRVISITYIILSGILLYNELFSNLDDISQFGKITKGSAANTILLGFSLLILERAYVYKVLIFALLSLVVFFLLSAKAAILVITFFIISFIFHDKKNLLFLFIGIILFSIIFLFGYLEFFLENENFSKLVSSRIIELFGGEGSDYATQDVRGNLELRMNAIALFSLNPIIGIGLDNERVYLGTQAHSAFISLLVGTGIIGLILFFYFTFYILFKSFKFRYNDVKIIVLLYLTWAVMNPVYTNASALLVLFIFSSLFIIKMKEEDNEI